MIDDRPDLARFFRGAGVSKSEKIKNDAISDDNLFKILPLPFLNDVDVMY